MAHRNFSMVDYINRRAKDWQPLLSFQGSTQDEWAQWREAAFARYIKLLGEFPRPVDLAPEVIYAIEENGLIRERVVFNSEEFMSVPCQVLRPADMKPDGSNAAILCSHGHGPFGKDPVAERLLRNMLNYAARDIDRVEVDLPGDFDAELTARGL